MAPKREFEPAEGTAVATETEKKEKLQRPRMYRVLFHNDNYTTMEFVVAVLRDIFRKTEAEAVAIMLNVHRSGIGVAGVYTYEIAETKARATEALARQNEFPLKVSVEPDEEG